MTQAATLAQLASSGALSADTSGNVGIGTTTPKSTLDVNGPVIVRPTYGTYLVNSYYDGAWKYIGDGFAWGIGDNFGGVSNGVTIANAAVNASGANAALTWIPRLSIDISGNLRFNSGYGSVATAYGCRAWVNFNGTGTVAIRSSGNVTSITDNGVGDYTLNITTALPDANYAAVGSAENGRILQNNTSRTNTTTVVNVLTRNVADSNADSGVVTVSVLR